MVRLRSFARTWHGVAASGVQSGLQLQAFIRKLDSVYKNLTKPISMPPDTLER
jgi:hypothetical protein